MKKLITLSIFFISIFGWSQVSIGNEDPQGALDINKPDGTNSMGLVIPIVDAVDPMQVGTSTYPTVTTTTGTYRQVQQTVDGEIERYIVPNEDAPEGTFVYDDSKRCLRLKKSAAAIDYTGCLVDSTDVSNEVNYKLYGGANMRIKKASAGYHFSLAIGADDNAVYAAGLGSLYRTGKGSTGASPWSMIMKGPAKDVIAGYTSGMAILEDGTLWSWGANTYGNTCLRTFVGYTQTPMQVYIPDNEKVKKVVKSAFNTLILTEKGNLYTCGYGGYGHHANGSTAAGANNKHTPELITSIPKDVVIKDIAISPRVAGILSEDGKVYTWGWNYFNMTGQPWAAGVGGTHTTRPTLLPNVNDTVKFKALAFSFGNGIAVTEQDELYTWGDSRPYNQPLGTQNGPNNIVALRPARQLTLDEGETIKFITGSTTPDFSYGYSTYMIITSENRIFTAGYNYFAGKLGTILSNGAASPGWGNAEVGYGFREIHMGNIFSGADVLGGSIGLYHSLIYTGTNEETPNSNYISYGSGWNIYNQMRPGAAGGNSVIFTTLKK